MNLRLNLCHQLNRFYYLIQRDLSTDLNGVKLLFESKFKIYNITIDDLKTIQNVCKAVSTRAANLTACGIAAIVKHLNKSDGCTVGIIVFMT